MTEPIFESEQHREFYEQNMARVRNDGYHRALFYLLGVSADTRRNIRRIFNFEEDHIRIEGLDEGWQTSGSIRLCHLAFNLWNGYVELGREHYFLPDNIFACGYAPYMMEAVKLRYPEYFRQREMPLDKVRGEKTQHRDKGDAHER